MRGKAIKDCLFCNLGGKLCVGSIPAPVFNLYVHKAKYVQDLARICIFFQGQNKIVTDACGAMWTLKVQIKTLGMFGEDFDGNFYKNCKCSFVKPL